MHKFLLPLLGLAILLSGCTPPPAEDADTNNAAEETVEEEVQEEKKAELPIRETRNVRYKGVVRPSGISIYQEGSHRLLLDDGRFILLESSSLDLNGYVDEEVDVRGALRPTVEAGGMIMRVEKISLIEPKPEPVSDETDDTEDTDEPTDDVASDEEPSDESSDEPEEEVEETPLSTDDTDTPVDDTPAKPEPTPEPVEDDEKETEDSPVDLEEDTKEDDPVDPEEQARIDQMVAQNYESSQWTQEYCSSHIGFCVPIHRNWWYKSFGATSSSLWHVETSLSEIEALWEGVIRIDLRAGGVGGKKASDGQVRVEGSTVVGYKEWTDNRHFEISADASLEEPVRYLLENLRSAE